MNRASRRKSPAKQFVRVVGFGDHVSGAEEYLARGRQQKREIEKSGFSHAPYRWMGGVLGSLIGVHLLGRAGLAKVPRFGMDLTLGPKTITY